MLEEKTRLLALAEANPLQALHVSAGRIRHIEGPADGFAAVYIPSPVNNEYTALLNTSAPALAQKLALRAIVRHHTQGHAPQRIHVFDCSNRTCDACIAASSRPLAIHSMDDYHRRTMRRLNWG